MIGAAVQQIFWFIDKQHIYTPTHTRMHANDRILCKFYASST